MHMHRWETIKKRSEALRNYTARNLSQIVKIPSLSGREEAVINRLKELCEEADFDEVRIDGLGNLIGRVGNGPLALAIDAHIDTVDSGDAAQWNLPPFSGAIRNGNVHGRGAVDQKGGAASMITAGRILKEMGYAGACSIYYTFTVMEEDCDGMCWNYLIEHERLRPAYVVITEPTDLGLYRGHRGRMEIELHVSGVSAHASAPERGDNAIYRAAELALKIRRLNPRLKTDPFLGKGSVAVTEIRSSAPSLCAVPDQCMLHLDRRLTWDETKETAVRELEALAGQQASLRIPLYNRQSYKGTVFGQEKYFPTWIIAEDHHLVEAGARTYTLLFNEPPRMGRWTFSTNATAVCGKHAIPCIGFGPGNEIQAHAPNEFVPVDHLVKAASFYALLPYILEEKVQGPCPESKEVAEW